MIKRGITISCLILFISLSIKAYPIPQYYCTGANEKYFERLLNLIGSIHKHNFDELEQIAVFNLGLDEMQIAHLKKIQKVKLYTIEEDNPHLLTYTYREDGTRCPLGWYAWKPVVLKESLEMFRYVVWLDAGTTVLKPLDHFFEALVKNGYFLCTVGDKKDAPYAPIVWQTTTFLREEFKLDHPENSWILPKEAIMSGIVGCTRNAFKTAFGLDWYLLSKDSRFFADDGTTPKGYGTGRHDQAVLGILGYLKGLKIHDQDYTQRTPMYLSLNDSEVPFYITWHPDYVSENTCIYSSRGDLKNKEHYFSCIRYKE